MLNANEDLDDSTLLPADGRRSSFLHKSLCHKQTKMVIATRTFLFSISALIILQACNTQRFGQSNYQQNSFQNAPVNQPQGSTVHCPEANGTFPTNTCDGYIECKNGVGEEKLCADGLLFNAAVGGFPCQYPIDVDCTGREQTQPAQATEDCPHQFGYYRVGDAQNCGQFMNCASGRGFVLDCPEGLAFNSLTYRCDWPDQVPDCDAEAYLGFTCPPTAKGYYGEEYRYFRKPDDCQRYFLCIEGRPRMYNCGEGKAYDEENFICDGVENVTGCAPSYNANYDQKRNQPQQFRG